MTTTSRLDAIRPDPNVETISANVITRCFLSPEIDARVTCAYTRSDVAENTNRAVTAALHTPARPLTERARRVRPAIFNAHIFRKIAEKMALRSSSDAGAYPKVAAPSPVQTSYSPHALGRYA